jgi:cytidylate kinase
MIVSISRELGAGGLTVGEAVAKALGAELLDERKVIGILASRLGLSENYVAGTVERPRKFAEELLIDIAYASAMLVGQQVFRPNDEELIAAARAVVTETAERGHVVVIGHGGPALLQRFERADKLTILLHASPAFRVAQVAQRLGLDEEEARRRVERVDRARALYLQRHFDLHLYEARNYDLVLNTEFLGLENAAAMACASATAAVARRGAQPNSST